MKPAIVADEMFPEGAGPYMDVEDVSSLVKLSIYNILLELLLLTFLTICRVPELLVC